MARFRRASPSIPNPPFSFEMILADRRQTGNANAPDQIGPGRACISDTSQTSSGAGEFVVYTDSNSLDILLA
jgi:hypothetical protein